LDAGTDTDIFYRKYNTATRTWDSIVLLSEFSQSQSSYPAITVDSSDNLHVVWGEYENYNDAGTDRDVFYRRYNQQSQQWETPIVVSEESSSTSYAMSIAVDSMEIAHIAWSDYDSMLGSGTDHDIFYRKYTPQSGLSPLELLTDQSTLNSETSDIQIDSQDNIHVLWTDATDLLGAGTDTDVFYRFFNNASLMWSDYILISDQSTGTVFRPDIAIDNWNNLHIVWSDATDYLGSGTDYDILYTQYNVATRSFSIPDVVSVNCSEDSNVPVIEVDSADRVHVVWKDYTDYLGSGTDYDVFYTTYDMNSDVWIPPYDLSGNNGSSGDPEMVIDRSDTVHVVWRDPSMYQEVDYDYDLFYRRYGGSPATVNLNLVHPNPSQGSVILNWNPAYGALRYSVYRTTTLPFGQTSNTIVGQTTGTTLTDVVTASGQYFYAIRAENSLGSSELSNIETVNVLQPMDETTTATVTVSGMTTVTQNNSEAKSPIDPIFILLGLVTIVLVIPYRRRHKS
jgi:ribosomal protein L31